MSREAEMFGEALKRWRVKRDLTQEALAHEAGITTSYASQVERGKKAPTLTVILKLCRALECTPSELLSDFTATALKRLRFV
jgi:XRE family transcriptional regulator, regulator of sulfur utilization